MHITSFLILCRPQNRHSVAQAAAALPGLEVRHCGDDGKIVALAEGGTESHITTAMQRLQELPEVVAVNLVYHGVDEDDAQSAG